MRLFLLLFSSGAFAQGIITTLAGNDAIFADDGKPAINAALVGPAGRAIDTAGNIFVASPPLNMVLKVDVKGVITVVARNGASDGTQSVVAPDNPAHAGDRLVIYCDELGDVDRRQAAGSRTPFTPLSQTLERRR